MMTSRHAIAPISAPTPIPATSPRFFEALSYPEIGVTIGVRFVEGAGYRVIARSADGERHMSPAAARRLASELQSDDPAVQEILAKAAAGLCATADQLETLLTKPAEGSA
jgi:uncharacterized membrane-anchored protein